MNWVETDQVLAARRAAFQVLAARRAAFQWNAVGLPQ